MIGPEIVQKTSYNMKTIQGKMKASQSRQKSYHDKRRKAFEFQKGGSCVFGSYFSNRWWSNFEVSKAHVMFYWSTPDLVEDM